MTTVSRFSRQNDAGLRALTVVLCENFVLVVVLVLESKALLKICDGDVGENVTSKYKFAISFAIIPSRSRCTLWLKYPKRKLERAFSELKKIIRENDSHLYPRVIVKCIDFASLLCKSTAKICAN